MDHDTLIQSLYRAEYSKMVALLCSVWGLQYVQEAEDVVGDTFLKATQIWPIQGLPQNPTAWLYTVAKNQARDVIRRKVHFQEKIQPAIRESLPLEEDLTLDLSESNIRDRQLQMIFAVCQPTIPQEAQVGLALRILCGFSIEEIALAFVSNKDAINKRLYRAKEKLRKAQVSLVFPSPSDLLPRLDAVLTTLYLLFNEGYYSTTQHTQLRKDFCAEAMRLTYVLTQHELTAVPEAYALLSLMCFHTSRFDARQSSTGETILYSDQDQSLWEQALIERGNRYLNLAARGERLTRYHLEAAISYWHTQPDETADKWEHILQLYNQLLQLAYSPIAALNRTYALARARNKQTAIQEALKLNLDTYHLYHALLGELYMGVNTQKALAALERAYQLAQAAQDKKVLKAKIHRLSQA